jgi:2-dehydropantoate 2-reductase
LRIALIGPGAIGTTVAAALAEVGRPPLLYGRSQRTMLELRPDDGAPIVVPGPVHTDLDATVEPVDLVFFAVKATQTTAARAWLARLCTADTVVCVLQNGVEHVENVRPFVGGASIVPAIVWFPAETQPEGWVRLRGEPRLAVAAEHGAAHVAGSLRGSRCTVEIDDDFVSNAWRKLLQNAAAGLMALTGRRSGMFARTDVARLAEAYVEECATVGRAEGAELPSDIAADVVARFQQFPPDLGSSILADRLAGRPLEWDLRNGVVVRKARQHGIATPVSDVVVPLLAAASDGPG